MRRKYGFAVLALLFFVPAVFFGCAGHKLLPSSDATNASTLNSYGKTYAAFKSVKLRETTIADLKKMGFLDAGYRVNNFVEIRNYFLGSNPSYDIKNLPDGVQQCLEAKENCQGYKISVNVIHKKYVGSFWKHTFGFKKEQDIISWNCRMLFVIVNDVVVYKLWSGTPENKEHTTDKKPLGPLQGIGESGLRRAADVIH